MIPPSPTQDCCRWGLPLLLLTGPGRAPAEAELSRWNQALTLPPKRLTLNSSDSDLHSWYFFPQPLFSLADATQHCIPPGHTLLFKVTERAWKCLGNHRRPAQFSGDLQNVGFLVWFFFFPKSPRNYWIGHFLNDTSIEKVTGCVTTAKSMEIFISSMRVQYHI